MMFRSLAHRRHLLRTVPVNFVRRQHNGQPPHKTYFQAPMQAPSSAFAGPAAAHRVRSPWVSWSTLSIRAMAGGALLGFSASLSLITWDYMEDPYENGSEADVELVEEIEDIFNDHIPVIQHREDPNYQEVQPYWVSSGDHPPPMILGPLNGSRGILWKMFWNENLKSMTIFVFFGNGVEGWPDLVHGGMLSTVLDEALGRVAANTFPGYAAVCKSLEVNFIKPLRPGSIYQVRAHPDDLILDMKHGVATIPDTDERKQKATILGVILSEGGGSSGSPDVIYAEARGTYTNPTPLQQTEDTD